MSPSRLLRIGQVVRYPDPPDQHAEYLDGHRNFFHLTAVSGGPRLIMNRGIDHPAWVTASDGDRRPVILLRSNPLRAGTAKTPWNDVFDMDAGLLRYYGDHRPDSPEPLGNTRGNAALIAAAEAHVSTDRNQRAAAVPLVVFRSVKRDGRPKGYLEFCGLGVIQGFEAEKHADPNSGQTFPNYAYNIVLLDLTSEGNALDWQWINDRRDTSLSTDKANVKAPSSWHAWIEGGNAELDVLRHLSSEMTGQKTGLGDAKRSPDWTRDELILACALVYRNGWHEVRRDDERAVRLSEILRSLPFHPPEDRPNDFRNPNSVQRKTADIETCHPDYPKKQTKGGRLTREVVMAFIEQPGKMLASADRITAAITSQDPALSDAISIQSTEEDIDETSAVEGRILERIHRYRERSPKLRRKKIKEVLRSHGSLDCEVCGFNFMRKYGAHGDGYIEVHHVTPLHEAQISETRLTDLALLCANCHRMSHRRFKADGAWPSPQDLRNLIPPQDN